MSTQIANNPAKVTPKRVAILQSNYIPWKGYFDLIAAVDEFILYDDMQFTRRDWRNRNKIKTPNGLQWLTVPVKKKGRYYQAIKDTEIADSEWRESHWKTIRGNYRRAKHFESVAHWLEPMYLSDNCDNLSHMNEMFIRAICKQLNIDTKISRSSDYALKEGKTERLAGLCVQATATEYISGPAARDYIDPEVFANENLSLTWFNYSGFAEHPQLWGDFEHCVTVLDLLFNCGPNACNYLRHTTAKTEHGNPTDLQQLNNSAAA